MVLGILFVLQIIASTSAWLYSQFGLLLYLKSVASGFIGDACLAFTAITVTYMLLSREPAATTNATRHTKLASAAVTGRRAGLADHFTAEYFH